MRKATNTCAHAFRMFMCVLHMPLLYTPEVREEVHRQLLVHVRVAFLKQLHKVNLKLLCCLFVFIRINVRAFSSHLYKDV